jgi:hypothetical protein
MSDDVEVTPLGAAMDDARLELGLRWSQVAKGAGMTPQNLLRIRKGEIAVTPLAGRSIELTLNWPRGRVEELEEQRTQLPDPAQFDNTPVEEVARAIAAMIDSDRYSDQQIADTIRAIRQRRSIHPAQSDDLKAQHS